MRIKQWIAAVLIGLLILAGTAVGESRTLRPGDRGDAVLALQQALNRLGYLGPEDGSYGEQTVRAVQAFQGLNGLKADGVAGSGTQSALFGNAARPYQTDWPDRPSASGQLSVRDGRVEGTLQSGQWRGEDGEGHGSLFVWHMKDAFVHVDCALPAQTTPEQEQLLEVGMRKISKKELAKALKDAGFAVELDALKGYADKRDAWSAYRGEDDLWGWADEAPVSQEPFTPAMEQAREALLSGARALEIEVYEPSVFVYTRGTGEYPYTRRYAASEAWAEKRRMEFEKKQRKAGVDTTGYSFASARIMLRGLPVTGDLAWKDGKAIDHMNCGVSAVTRPDGTLAFFAQHCALVEKSASDAQTPLLDWEACLRKLLDGEEGFWLFEMEEDAPLMSDVHGEQIQVDTVLAMQSVLTSVEPCWVAEDMPRLTPGYAFTFETRVIQTGAVTAAQTYYVSRVAE